MCPWESSELSLPCRTVGHHVSIGLSDLSTTHELLHCSNHGVCVFACRRVGLDHASIPISDDKDGLVVSIVLFSNSTIVDIVERNKVPTLSFEI